MFVTYSPVNKTHRTAFGNEFVIEGIGEVHVQVFARGQSITLNIKDCWHVPNSPNNFFSTLSGCLRGNQHVIASQTPRMLFPHKFRILQPNSPKYVPFTRENGFIVLRFQPLAPIAPALQPNPPPLPQSFAGLSFYPPSFIPPSIPSVSSLNQLSSSNPLSALPVTVSRIDESPAPLFDSHPIQLSLSPTLLDWPFCSLTFDSHLLPDFCIPPLNSPLEVPAEAVSTIHYAVTNFHSQSMNSSHEHTTLFDSSLPTTISPLPPPHNHQHPSNHAQGQALTRITQVAEEAQCLNWPRSGSRTFRTWFGPEPNLRFGVHVRPMSEPEPLSEPNVQVLRGFTTPVVDFISRIQKEL